MRKSFLKRFVLVEHSKNGRFVSVSGKIWICELYIGTAYPVWTGIGAVGTVVLGIMFFHEPVSFLRLFFITTLIASIVGLKLVSH